MFSSDSRFTINLPRVHHERFADEAVLVNVESGYYYSLTSSGADILALLNQGVCVSDLGRALFGDGVVPLEHEQAIARLLEDLLAEGIIVKSDATNGLAAGTSHPDISEPLYPNGSGFERPILERFDEVRDLLLIDPIHMVNQDLGWPKSR